MICHGCRANVDHCHGALFVHADGVVECTEVGCLAFDRARHDYVVVCDETADGCACLLAQSRGRRTHQRATPHAA